MEEGSLLQEVLHQANKNTAQRELHNAILIDIYALDYLENACSSIEHLLYLAKLASICNEYVQSKPYPWYLGEQGRPLFGIHVQEEHGIPCLRAICRYEANVDDEWMAILILKEASRQHTRIAIECWDVDDGQILLIQSAEHLPDWVDAVGPSACRHRCWIVNDTIVLIPPLGPADMDSATQSESLSLPEALNWIASRQPQDFHTNATTPSAVLCAISQRIHGISQKTHRAALVVPRSVAILLRERPDLVNAASVAFDEASSQGESRFANEEWVWARHSFARTNYARLCTVVNRNWKTPDFIPKVYRNVQTSRFQRTCSFEATPHVRTALQIGVRITAGLEVLLAKPSPVTVPSEQRVCDHWTRIDREASSRQSCPSRNGEWLKSAWVAGPNQAAHSLVHVINCPVFREEVLTGSCRKVSLPDQIRQALKPRKGQPESLDVTMPRASDVDDETKWMTMPAEIVEPLSPEKVISHTDKKESDRLESMLGGFQSFVLEQKSGMEGVSSSKESDIRIRPRVFLNLLYQTLKATTLDEITLPTARDPYFSDEDYTAFDDNDEERDEEMVQAMRAMDDELRGTAAAREVDSDEVDADIADDRIQEDAHVLSNLLKSLDAGGGAPGPVLSMMKEMGIDPPDDAIE